MYIQSSRDFFYSVRDPTRLFTSLLPVVHIINYTFIYEYAKGRWEVFAPDNAASKLQVHIFQVWAVVQILWILVLGPINSSWPDNSGCSNPKLAFTFAPGMALDTPMMTPFPSSFQSGDRDRGPLASLWTGYFASNSDFNLVEQLWISPTKPVTRCMHSAFSRHRLDNKICVSGAGCFLIFLFLGMTSMKT